MTEGSLPLSAFSKKPRYSVGNAYITAVFEVVQCEHNNFNLARLYHRLQRITDNEANQLLHHKSSLTIQPNASRRTY
jgi:hypothetical protein